MDCDTVVIGSGFGGAVTACRLAEAGDRVIVLERGRRWDSSNYPRGPTDRWWWSEMTLRDGTAGSTCGYFATLR